MTVLTYYIMYGTVHEIGPNYSREAVMAYLRGDMCVISLPTPGDQILYTIQHVYNNMKIIICV